MRILVDICHPAHAHFFRRPIALLRERGHEVLITSREKEIAVALLDRMGLEHEVLSAESGGGIVGLGRELVSRNYALYRVVRRFRPDVMAAIGGIFIAQVGTLTGVPSVVFYDTENAVLQNLLTYPFASCVVAPRAYQAWLPRRHIRYPGYHELSYLHPTAFTPRREIAVANGLDPVRDTYFLRLVAWRANHDIGEKGWSTALLRRIVALLAARGKVLVSSEAPLPEDLAAHAYRGDPQLAHHVLAYSRLFVGESATMASECAVLGVPAIYAAHTGRGYTDEQEARYGLVKNLRELGADGIEAAIGEMLAWPVEHWQDARRHLLADTVDVADYAARCIEDYAGALARFRAGL